jgi:hypothetical protein
MRLQTLQPVFHPRIAAVFILAIVFLGFLSFTKHGVFRAYFGGIACLAAVALIVQYCRERTIVHNRLSAVGVVKEYKIRGKSAPYLGKGVMVIKYEFVGFDQKTYKGETGWGATNLYEGSRVTVLYDPGNPSVNHPLTSFIFYSFH